MRRRQKNTRQKNTKVFWHQSEVRLDFPSPPLSAPGSSRMRRISCRRNCSYSNQFTAFCNAIGLPHTIQNNMSRKKEVLKPTIQLLADLGTLATKCFYHSLRGNYKQTTSKGGKTSNFRPSPLNLKETPSPGKQR